MAAIITKTRPAASSSASPALAQIDRYECVGIGRQLARFIIEAGSDPKAPDLELNVVERVCTLAIQALIAAKDHVDGVGGESEFLLVDPDKTSDIIPFISERVEPLARAYHHYAVGLLATLTDPSADESFVKYMTDGFVDLARRTRERWGQFTMPQELIDGLLRFRAEDEHRTHQWRERRIQRRREANQSTRKGSKRER